jgi:hypothetical protein
MEHILPLIEAFPASVAPAMKYRTAATKKFWETVMDAVHPFSKLAEVPCSVPESKQQNRPTDLCEDPMC